MTLRVRRFVAWRRSGRASGEALGEVALAGSVETLSGIEVHPAQLDALLAGGGGH